MTRLFATMPDSAPLRSSEKRRPLLVLGFLGMALFAIGDVLLQSFSKDGTVLLVIMNSSIQAIPMGRLYFTLLTGVIAAPFMYLGLCAMDSCLRDALDGKKEKMYCCFQIGAIIGTLSFFAAHSVCAVLEISVKLTLLSGMEMLSQPTEKDIRKYTAM